MQITFDFGGHWFEVNGVKYDPIIFVGMGDYPEGTFFKLVKRENDGWVTIRRYDPRPEELVDEY